MSLGGMGILTGIGGFANQLFASFMQDTAVKQLEAEPDRADLQLQVDIHTSTKEITDRYFWENTLATTGVVVACTILLVGTILVLPEFGSGTKDHGHCLLVDDRGGSGEDRRRLHDAKGDDGSY